MTTCIDCRHAVVDAGVVPGFPEVRCDMAHWPGYPRPLSVMMEARRAAVWQVMAEACHDFDTMVG